MLSAQLAVRKRTRSSAKITLAIAVVAIANATSTPADARPKVAFTGPHSTGGSHGDPHYAYSFKPDHIAATGPKIFRVQLNSNELHARGPIAIRVTTSRDVETVTSGSGNHTGALKKISPGVFASDSTLPSTGVPFFKMHLSLHFTATTAAGKSTSTDVPVTYH